MNIVMDSQSIVIIIGALITGFFKKMGEDIYSLMRKLISREPKFVEVDKRYEPDTSDGASLSWVSEAKLYERKNLGYKFRIIDEQNQGCYRHTSDGRATYKEYLMIKPS